MIDAMELRIGNWVYNTQYKEDMQVEDGGHIDGIFEWGGCDPIIITPEVLDKCGLKNIRRNTYRLKKIEILYTIDKNCEVWLIGCGWINKSTPIKHLHQLQNLFFALTGTELTYTP